MKLHLNHSHDKGYESFDHMMMVTSAPYRQELGYRIAYDRWSQADRRDSRRKGYGIGFLKIRPWRG